MDRAFAAGMPVVRFVAVILACSLPSIASAQAWAQAYRAGDYGKAATLLHVIVTDPDYLTSTHGDPLASRQLALMYAKGIGVSPDPIAACALAQMAEAATLMAPPRYASDIFAYQASQQEAEQFKHEHCAPLSHEERLIASRAMSCPAFGVPETVLTVGGQLVRVGRGGIRLAEAPVPDAADMSLCCAVLAHIAVRSIEPPADAAPGVEARHFVEVFSWRAGRHPNDGALKYILMWQAFEIRRDGVGYFREQELQAAPSWPDPPAPPDLGTRVSLEMIRSGHVRWRIPGAPPKRGWLMLPEERERR